jgi:twitching motility protein PilT
MAALDVLLRSLVKNRMQGLWLDPGRLPRLVRDGAEHEVTQTAMDAARIAQLVNEVAPAGWAASEVGSDAPHGFEYPLDGELFQFRVAAGAPGWSVRATRRAAAAAPPRPSADAAAAPAPTPAAAEAEAPISAIVPLLEELLARQGSDLHLSTGHRPRIRIHGELADLPGYRAPDSERLQQVLFEITPERNREQYQATSDTDFAHELPGKARFRINLFRDQRGFGAVLRVIPSTIPTIDELGLPEVVRKLAHLSKGLVLVTGPTGSGKSTTLAAIIDLINRTRTDHILTIEDPVEFVHASKKCLVNQREVGVHTASFKQALRAALREDPDVVLVGEMRDLETIAIAIETAETGHLVFGTLHTSTAPSTIERLVDQFPGDRQGQIRMMLSDSLRAVIAQTLLKKIGGGRVAAYEILISTPAVANLIREGKTFQIASAMQTGKAVGMVLLNDALLGLVEKKLVEPREAYLKAVDKEALLARFRSAGENLDFLEELRAQS